MTPRAKKKSTTLENIKNIILGFFVFIFLVFIPFILWIGFLISNPDYYEIVDRAFRALLPFLIVGACIAIGIAICYKIWKKQQKK